MREKRFRNKITWFSFAFSLLVIWIHACNAELFLGTGEKEHCLFLVERFMGDRIGQIAVPGFFMISGYQFFRNLTWKKMGGKLERRIYSILVPYILWNFLYYTGYVISSRIPWMRTVVGKGVIPVSLSELTDAILNFKYNPVFWFLYQLILLIAVSPLLYAVLKRISTRIAFFALLGIVLIGDIRLPFLNADALLYYSAAGAAALTDCIAIREARGPRGQRARQIWGLLLLLLGIGADCLGRIWGMPAFLAAGRLFAVTGLWMFIPARNLPESREIVKHSFFLYATHFALVRLINKSAAELLPDASVIIPFLLYLLMPGIVLGISSGLLYILRRVSPGLCRVLNGGRTV